MGSKEGEVEMYRKINVWNICLRITEDNIMPQPSDSRQDK